MVCLSSYMMKCCYLMSMIYFCYKFDLPLQCRAKEGGVVCIILSSTIKKEVVEFCFTKDLDGSGTEDTVGSREKSSVTPNFETCYSSIFTAWV